MLGVALVTTAGFSWLFVLPIQLRGHSRNPYIGIVVFIFIPVIFVFGLILIALGVFLARRRIERAEQALLATGRPTILHSEVRDFVRGDHRGEHRDRDPSVQHSFSFRGMVPSRLLWSSFSMRLSMHPLDLELRISEVASQTTH